MGGTNTISLVDGRCVIHVGDVFERLAQMPDESVDCVVTSPPYWGLRDYDVDGQIGMEPTLGEHLVVMVAVFEEIRRVLKDTGTLWLNYGDCYATAPNGRSAAETKSLGKDDRTFRDKPFSTVGPIFVADHEKGDRRSGDCKQRTHDNGSEQHRGRIVAGGYLKPKDLCMLPNRLAIALQDAGWWVRSEIIWAKPNPMPESVRDRPAGAHEKIFLLTKAARYAFNGEAVKQPVSKNTHARISQDLANQVGSYRANGGKKSNGPMRAVVAGSTRKLAAENQSMIGQKASRESSLALMVDSRNLRNFEPAPLSVWVMPTAAFREAHFATFPPELVERCIDAGCPTGGHVLDPFGGAGTTALVALAKGRTCELIELNSDYASIAARRVSGAWQGDVESTVARLKAEPDPGPGPLFSEAAQ